MSYDSYQLRSIFDEPRLNAMSDFLIDNLLEAFPKSPDEEENEFVLKGFVLSGKASAILQGRTGSISNVTFQTDKAEIYKWCLENLGSKLFKCKQISFKNRILFYPHPDLYFELWWTPIGLRPMVAETIFIQPLSEIPIETL